MKIENGFVEFDFEFGGIECPHEASYEECVHELLKSRLEDLFHRRYIGSDVDKFLQFRDVEDAISKTMASKYLELADGVEAFLRDNEEELESIFYTIAEEEFEEYHFYCDFCGEAERKEEREDDFTEWNLCCKCAYKHKKEYY